MTPYRYSEGRFGHVSYSGKPHQGSYIKVKACIQRFDASE
jgi:hypothetical protein